MGSTLASGEIWQSTTTGPPAASAARCTGMRIARTGDIEPVLRAALAAGGPVVVDCQISPDANVLPMIPPGGTVENILLEMEED